MTWLEISNKKKIEINNRKTEQVSPLGIKWHNLAQMIKENQKLHMVSRYDRGLSSMEIQAQRQSEKVRK
jgi:hypothetical protein